MKKYSICKYNSAHKYIYVINGNSEENVKGFKVYSNLNGIIHRLVSYNDTELDDFLNSSLSHQTEKLNIIFEFNDKYDILKWVKEHPEELI